jgi:uncharacterized protein (UPF0333 family)
MVIDNKKSQTSSEFLLVVGFLLVILIPLVIIGFIYPQQGEAQITTGQVTGMAISIADAAEEVYYVGEPAKTTLKLYVPKNIKNISIDGNRIIFKVQTIHGLTDIVENLPFNASGNLTPTEGIKYVKIESRGDYVWISE